MKRMFFVWAAATLAAVPVYGQTAAPQGPATERQSETPSVKSDRARLEADVRYLAHDSLEGREAGTTGYALAAGYVAGQFAALGINPAGNGGTYFQSVPMVSSRLEFGGQSGLQIANAQGAAFLPEGTAGEDYFTFPKRGNTVGEVEGELVFVGYGFAADGYEQDDFAGIDLNGKVAVVISGAPPTLNSEERAYFGDTLSQRLSERGAVGIISLFTPTDAQLYTFEQLRGNLRSTLMAWAQPDGTVFSKAPGIQGSAILGSALSQALFDGQPVSFEDVDAYQSGKRADLPSFAMGLRARIMGESTVGTLTSPNVIGMIPGTDPAVADEYVVVTAHLDHIGIVPTPEEGDDEIFNGAMDNATGVASMIEVARLIRDNPGRRPVVFLAVTAEEKGLIGSDYFARNPTLGHGELVANINLDMPVVTHEFTDVIAFGAERSTLLPEVQAAAASHGITLSPDPMPQRGLFTRSDQYSFVQQGVPAIFLVTRRANRDKAPGKRWNHYHKVTDEVSFIDFEQLGRFTDVNQAIIRNVANMAEKPVWNAGDFFAKTFGGEMAQ
jgi:hypothetical protein